MSGAWVYNGPGLPEGYEAPSLSLDVVRLGRARGGVVRSRGAVVSFNGDGEAIRVGDRVHDHRRYERARAESCGQTEPHLGRTPAEAAENLRIRLGRCPHGLAEEVVLCTGEIVAAVCPTCWETLPASFVGSEWKP